jgi:hypothetical protein
VLSETGVMRRRKLESTACQGVSYGGKVLYSLHSADG